MKGTIVIRIFVTLTLLTSASLFGQLFPQAPSVTPQQLSPQTANQQQTAVPGQLLPGMQQAIPGMAERLRPTYVLREGDQIVVRAQDVDELTDRPFRVEQDGTIKFPLIGQIKADGLTVEALEAAIVQQLHRFVVNPVVTINLAQFSSDPVFVIGWFRNTGIFPLVGKKTLLELLTQIGGLLPG